MTAAVQEVAAIKYNVHPLVEPLIETQSKEATAHTEIQWRLLKLGGEMGLDAEKARSCMYDYSLHQIVEKIGADGALRFGLTGVPAVIVNGKVVDSPHTAEELAAILDPLLAGK